jgi:hypothetical protein
VAAYQALFWASNTAPNVLTVTPHGFGGGCAELGMVDAPLHWVSHSRGQTPDYILFGDDVLPWTGYRAQGSCHGFTIWEKGER